MGIRTKPGPALAQLTGLLGDVRPIRAQLSRLSRKYQTLANNADRKARMYQERLETRGYGVSSQPEDQDAAWHFRFYNAYRELSGVYARVSKTLSVTHDKGSIHFGKLPSQPRDFAVLTQLAEIERQYADYRAAKRAARAEW